tara:strand:- start:17 stop:451 length:435 start_codon:yes stop_codon:yes gene_type:complete
VEVVVVPVVMELMETIPILVVDLVFCYIQHTEIHQILMDLLDLMVPLISGSLVVAVVDHILSQILIAVLVVVNFNQQLQLHTQVLVMDKVIQIQVLIKTVKQIVDLVVLEEHQVQVPVMEELVVLVLSFLLTLPHKYLKTYNGN